MKVNIRRWLGIAIVPVMLLMIGVSTPAYADEFVCSNESDPLIPTPPSNTSIAVPFQGAIVINSNSNNCEIFFDLHATLEVEINSNGPVTFLLSDGEVTSRERWVKIISNTGNIDLANTDIEASGYIQVQAGLNSGATSGDIKLRDLTVNVQDIQDNNVGLHGNVLLRARGNIGARDISTGGNESGGGMKTGAVQIDPHMFSTGTVPTFTVGGLGTNGVNSVDTRTETGGGPLGTFIEGGVRITNGALGAVGNITVTSMDSIKVRASQSRSGWIQFDARDGTISLPSGTLDASGKSIFRGGSIYLLAKTIDTANGTVLNSSQDPDANGSVRQIILAAEEINYQGEEGLTIKVNGNGISENPFLPGTLYVLPHGGLKSNSTDDPDHLRWSFEFIDGFFNKEGLVRFNGQGAAPIKMIAEGDHNQISITGYPIEFLGGGDVTIKAEGNMNHQVNIGYFGTYLQDGTTGLEFDSGKVVISANGMNGKGGYVQIQTDALQVKAVEPNTDPENQDDPRSFVVKADGDISDGGKVLVLVQSLGTDAATRPLISSDGAISGSGNGDSLEAIVFRVDGAASSIFLGNSNSEKWKLTSRGGMTDGNGGAIFVGASFIQASDQGSVNASAKDGDGNGGSIALSTLVGSQMPEKTFIATGKGQGEGGKFFVVSLPQFLEVNSVVNVSGGSNLTISDGKDGRIFLNGIQCQAYKVRSNYPKKYWRCDDDRDNPSANMKFALDELFKEIKGSGKTMLRDAGTELFFMNTLADVNTFYVQNEPIVPLGGFTFTSPLAPNTQTYVNVFTLVNGEDLLAFQEKLLSATGHEFGHAVDFTRGSESEMNPTYTTWVNSDIQFLNFNSDGTRRDPCVGSILHKAPFENVLDERSGNPLCVNGQLIAAYNQLPTNFDVLKSATRLGVFGGPPYDEPYAQVFGWASADAFQNQNDTLGYTITGVLNNDFFGCAAAWADAARNGQATPPSPPLGVTCQ